MRPTSIYSAEEISAALKQIKHDVNLLKIGPKKKDKRDKLRETICYLGLLLGSSRTKTRLVQLGCIISQDRPASSVISTPPSDETSKQRTQSLVDLNVVAAPAPPLPPKKIVFGVGKLKSCVKEEILEHLETIGLTAAECVPVLKFSPTRPQPPTSDPSTKFRITIFKHQEMIFTNPENWPIGVEIHPWLFHARPQHLIKPTTTSLPNHHPVDLPNVNTPSLVNSHQHVENTVEVASILTSSEKSTQPVESVTLSSSQLNLLDSFTRQSSYCTTRDLLNILEAKYINNHDHPLPLLHINSRKTWLNDETAKLQYIDPPTLILIS
ncbi:hypothetical protein HELRODRAFT_172153 [Helobdella robusta]|uniref:Uncharacterized protein n=1 Tax=Helobdella robusta TaxID=6412 RepID=T1F527_HELRO|nr:hypothetical protein HELRODRAFT_172153 [Helobdella robusta]ESO04506.1 hypothetical protein HELRODRAFT_172153 [Helobdella robusta]